MKKLLAEITKENPNLETFANTVNITKVTEDGSPILTSRIENGKAFLEYAESLESFDVSEQRFLIMHELMHLKHTAESIKRNKIWSIATNH